MDNNSVVEGDKSIWRIIPWWVKAIAGLAIFIAIIITFANATNKPQELAKLSGNCEVSLRITNTEKGGNIELFTNPIAGEKVKYLCTPVTDGADCVLP